MATTNLNSTIKTGGTSKQVQPQTGGFNYNYRPIDFATAQKEAAAQLDPIYSQAIKGVQQQKYTNDVQAGQVAAARGLGHSGLAADQLNKIAIAAQGNISDLNAKRASEIAQQANDMVQQDKQYALQDRAQRFNEYNSNRNYAYQASRDKVADSQWQQGFNYQAGRDKVADGQWNTTFNYQKAQDSSDKAWREYTYNNMSAQEKATLNWAKQQFGEEQAWKMFELKYNGQMQQSMNQAEIDAYTNGGFPTP